MTKIITVANTKGGVGKTTTAVYLAFLLSKTGSVLLKDADSQGSATEWIENINNAPIDFEIANLRNVDKVRKAYDYVIIDTSRDSAELVKKAVEMSDLVIIPSSPSNMDLTRVFSVVDYLSEDTKYRVLLTLADSRTNSFKYVKEALKEQNIEHFETFIPKREAIKNVFGNIPVRTEEIKEYANVVKEIEVLFHE